MVRIEYCSVRVLHAEQYSVSQKIPPDVLWHFFPNGSEFFHEILHICYAFLSTLDYKFSFNYL